MFLFCFAKILNQAFLYAPYICLRGFFTFLVDLAHVAASLTAALPPPTPPARLLYRCVDVQTIVLHFSSHPAICNLGNFLNELKHQCSIQPLPYTTYMATKCTNSISLISAFFWWCANPPLQFSWLHSEVCFLSAHYYCRRLQRRKIEIGIQIIFEVCAINFVLRFSF